MINLTYAHPYLLFLCTSIPLSSFFQFCNHVVTFPYIILELPGTGVGVLLRFFGKYCTPSTGQELAPSASKSARLSTCTQPLRDPQERQLTRLHGNINPILRTPRHMKMIINLIQHTPRTLNTSINTTPKSAQRLLNLGTRIRFCGTRKDTRYSEESVGIQELESDLI